MGDWNQYSALDRVGPDHQQCVTLKLDAPIVSVFHFGRQVLFGQAEELFIVPCKRLDKRGHFRKAQSMNEYAHHADTGTVVPTPGLEARRLAVDIIADTLDRRIALDECLQRLFGSSASILLPERDHGLVRAIAMVAIRNLGTLRRAISDRLPQGVPREAGNNFENILISGAAQLLFLDVPDHAAVDLTVRLVQADRLARRYVSLANGLLRRIAREKTTIMSWMEPLTDDTPAWLVDRWSANYGGEVARSIAEIHRHEPSVDITVKSDPELWAERLDAMILPTGSLRLRGRVSISDLPGYAEGEWWVQDAAAAIPVKLLAPQRGERIADLCAAPGGKTAQIALSGAIVTAVDRSKPRLERLILNLERLKLSSEIRAINAEQFSGGPFDAILLDAPCSSTGTIRRHPDVAWNKTEADVARLTILQSRLLMHAVSLLRPGGRLVYCTCSLEPEEGEHQIEQLLLNHHSVRRMPFLVAELPALSHELASALTDQGDLRTLPSMLPHSDARMAGLDGFFVARLIKVD